MVLRVSGQNGGITVFVGNLIRWMPGFDLVSDYVKYFGK
jgi:hypothetical protein